MHKNNAEDQAGERVPRKMFYNSKIIPILILCKLIYKKEAGAREP